MRCNGQQGRRVALLLSIMMTTSSMDGMAEMVQQSAKLMRLRSVSPHNAAAAVQQANIDWAQEFSLVPNEIGVAHARAIRAGELAAVTYPREPSAVVQLGADLVLWLYILDDSVGEAPADMTVRAHRLALRTYEQTIRNQGLPDSATRLHVALSNLVQRTVELGATRDWLNRFAADMENYFAGCIDETHYCRHRIIPSVKQYRDLRVRTVGTQLVFAIQELGTCGVVPQSEINRPDVIAARELAVLLTAWVNDVYSYPKELRSEAPLNLVTVLAHEYGLGTRDALQRAVELYNHDLGRLERMVEAIRTTTRSDSLTGYLDGMFDWIHGHRVWIESCGRY